MKLSQFENEEALEVLEKIMNPIAAIVTDSKIKKLLQDNKPQIFIAKEIVKNYKKEVIEILSALNGKTPDTYKFTLISLLKEISELMDELKDESELRTVFQLQSQMTEEESSGSVVENIKGAKT